MNPARVSLLTLGVADVSRSVTFYEAIGWRAAERNGNTIAFMAGEAIVLALWDRAEMIADGGEGDLPAGSGSAAFAVNFASADEVDAFYGRAIDAGARPVKPPAKVFWGGYSGNFRDPDGHLWEVAHNPFWRLDETGRLDLTPQEAPTPQVSSKED
ncbi:MAG: VOC family protein [Pseudomonadota bacterium]|nr:VOC family protein [Pseudomonadota bacterium]